MEIGRHPWKILKETYYGFIRDDCYARASALTFYSLLSIVPLLAVAFGIAKGFGFEKILESQIVQHFYDQQDFAHVIIGFAYSMLEHAQGGIIGGIGLLVLLWSVIGLLSNIESALNAIWRVTRPRSFSRRIADYLALMLISPFFFVVSGSLTVFTMTILVQMAHDHHILHTFSPLASLSVYFFPFVISWVLFSFLYIFMPNTEIGWRYGIMAGAVAGAAFQLVQWIYIHFQIGASSYGAIYGSFAAIPLFLLLVHTSWLVVLGGAELACQAENYHPASAVKENTLEFSKRGTALLLVLFCIQAFKIGGIAPDLKTLADKLGISLSDTQELLNTLVSARILSELIVDTKRYQPARDTHILTLGLIFSEIDHSYHEKYKIRSSPEAIRVAQSIQAFESEATELQTNVNLFDLQK